MASLGQSSEVLYHVTSFLTGMAPSKNAGQHSRPTLVARATEKETGTSVSVSVCERECLHGGLWGRGLWLWEDLRSVRVHVCVCGGESSCAYLYVCVYVLGLCLYGGCVCVRVSLGGSVMRAVSVFPCGKCVRGPHMRLRVCQVCTVVCMRPLCGLGEAPCVCIYARACVCVCLGGCVYVPMNACLRMSVRVRICVCLGETRTLICTYVSVCASVRASVWSVCAHPIPALDRHVFTLGQRLG